MTFICPVRIMYSNNHILHIPICGIFMRRLARPQLVSFSLNVGCLAYRMQLCFNIFLSLTLTCSLVLSHVQCYCILLSRSVNASQKYSVSVYAGVWASAE